MHIYEEKMHKIPINKMLIQEVFKNKIHVKVYKVPNSSLEFERLF